MKRFYVRGMAHTTQGLVLFQVRNKKDIDKILRRKKFKYIMLYQKLTRKGKIDYWVKMGITLEGFNE